VKPIYLRTPILAALLLASNLLAAGAFAQDKTSYALNEDQVHFQVPAGWSAVMEKKEGNPQAVAFQIPDPTAQGSEDSATVTVKSRLLKNADQFASVMLEEQTHAQEQSGFASDPSNKDTQINQYFVVRGKTKYQVRDSFHRAGSFAVMVRCQRPLLDKTPAAWASAFDSGCASVFASISP
jgi:hypothetical protein